MSISNILHPNNYNLYCNNFTVDGDFIINGDIIFSSLLPSSVLYLDSSKQLKTKQLTNGQLLIGSTGNIPVQANITTSTLNITNGPGSINIDTLSGSTFDNITLIGASNQLIFKHNNTTPTTSITNTNPASNRIITLSDPGGNDTFCYLNSGQTLNNKTINSQIFTGIASGDLNTTGNLITTAVVSSGNGYYNNGTINNFFKMYADQSNIFNITFSNPSATRVVNFNDPLADDFVGYLNATQTYTNKTLTLPKISTISNTGTITLPTTTCTLSGINLSETFSGIKTFSVAPVISTITNSGTITLPGLTCTLSGVSLTENYINKTIQLTNATGSYVPATLNYYEENSYTAVVSGPIPNTNMTVYLYRIGKIVNCYLSGIKVSGNMTSATISITGFASRFNPVGTGSGSPTLSKVTWGYDNGVTSQVLWQMAPSGGTMTIYKLIAGGSPGNFTLSSSATGFDGFSVTWVTS